MQQVQPNRLKKYFQINSASATNDEKCRSLLVARFQGHINLKLDFL